MARAAVMAARSSRLVTDLEAAIATARDPIEADSLRADLAAQWARLGRLDEAEAMLQGLRQKYRETSHPHLTPWLNFAEATIDLQAGRGTEAMIKMRRAHALSVAMALKRLTALAAATLAHWFWNEQDIDKAVGHAREALKLASRNDNRARCRVSLVVGEMLAISGRPEEAKAWYARSRHHGAESGDDAARSALNFNLAVVGLALLKQARFALLDFAADSSQAEAQRVASDSLDEIFKISVDDLSVFQQAQLKSITNQPVRALEAYRKLESRTFDGARRQRGVWLSDVAWCYARLGNWDDALTKAGEAVAAVISETQIDDLAAMHSRLSLTYALAGRRKESESHQALASELWDQYHKFQQRCAELCLTITEDG